MSSLIFVKNLIDAQRSAELLLAHRREMSKRKRPVAALLDALFDGYWELHCEAKRCAEEVVKRGQLLLAWDGTKVTEAVQ